jgi:hypothetical protein
MRHHDHREQYRADSVEFFMRHHDHREQYRADSVEFTRDINLHLIGAEEYYFLYLFGYH